MLNAEYDFDGKKISLLQRIAESSAKDKKGGAPFSFIRQNLITALINKGATPSQETIDSLKASGHSTDVPLLPDQIKELEVKENKKRVEFIVKDVGGSKTAAEDSLNVAKGHLNRAQKALDDTLDPPPGNPAAPAIKEIKDKIAAKVAEANAEQKKAEEQAGIAAAAAAAAASAVAEANDPAKTANIVEIIANARKNNEDAIKAKDAAAAAAAAAEIAANAAVGFAEAAATAAAGDAEAAAAAAKAAAEAEAKAKAEAEAAAAAAAAKAAAEAAAAAKAKAEAEAAAAKAKAEAEAEAAAAKAKAEAEAAAAKAKAEAEANAATAAAAAKAKAEAEAAAAESEYKEAYKNEQLADRILDLTTSMYNFDYAMDIDDDTKKRIFEISKNQETYTSALTDMVKKAENFEAKVKALSDLNTEDLVAKNRLEYAKSVHKYATEKKAVYDLTAQRKELNTKLTEMEESNRGPEYERLVKESDDLDSKLSAKESELEGTTSDMETTKLTYYGSQATVDTEDQEIEKFIKEKFDPVSNDYTKLIDAAVAAAELKAAEEERRRKAAEAQAAANAEAAAEAQRKAEANAEAAKVKAEANAAAAAEAQRKAAANAKAKAEANALAALQAARAARLEALKTSAAKKITGVLTPGGIKVTKRDELKRFVDLQYAIWEGEQKQKDKGLVKEAWKAVKEAVTIFSIDITPGDNFKKQIIDFLKKTFPIAPAKGGTRKRLRTTRSKNANRNRSKKAIAK